MLEYPLLNICYLALNDVFNGFPFSWKHELRVYSSTPTAVAGGTKQSHKRVCIPQYTWMSVTSFICLFTYSFIHLFIYLCMHACEQPSNLVEVILYFVMVEIITGLFYGNSQH